MARRRDKSEPKFTAISSAESSLETVIAVRDQVIQAYQEILRMPV